MACFLRTYNPFLSETLSHVVIAFYAVWQSPVELDKSIQCHDLFGTGMYDACGFINHAGTSENGHYVCHLTTSATGSGHMMQGPADTCVTYDDERVTEMSFGTFSGSAMNKRSAYQVLFRRRDEPSDSMLRHPFPDGAIPADGGCQSFQGSTANARSEIEDMLSSFDEKQLNHVSSFMKLLRGSPAMSSNGPIPFGSTDWNDVKHSAGDVSMGESLNGNEYERNKRRDGRFLLF